MSTPRLSPVPQPEPFPLWMALALIGFTAITAQIVLMRELMVVFYGNEISLGVMLACWLLWTAFGSNFLGKLSPGWHDPRRLMAGLQLLLAVVLPGTIAVVRASRNIFNATPGEILGPGPMFLTCFAGLSLFCAVSGWLFVAGSQVCACESKSSSTVATGSVYLFEAVGSALGGVVASLFLIRHFTSFDIALLISLLNLLVAAGLAIRTFSYRLTTIAILLGLFIFLVFPIAGRRLERASLARLWPGLRLVAARNSVYGNLALVETPGSRSLFENGLLMFNTPDPAAAEEAVHFALLQHPLPKSLLLIGGGVNGTLIQALQHPSLERVDYVELDPTILDLAQRYLPEQWSAGRADTRVHVHHADGRLFLKSTSRTFDVVIVNLPDPQTAQVNRFYTLEFFQETAAKLNAGGVLSFQLRASEEYFSPELSAFLRCINKTLQQVFPTVTAIPGESVHFFAVKQGGLLATTPQDLLSRLQARRLQTQYVREYYIPFRMMPDRMLDLERQIQPVADTPVNRDFAPIAYYFDIALWSTQFNREYRRIFESVAQVSFAKIAVGITVLLLMVGAAIRCFLRGAARIRGSAGFCVAVMGFTLMSLQVLLLLGFQAIYGYVYHQLAILIAFFMVGIAVGSWWSLRRYALPRTVSDRDNLIRLAGLQLLAASSPVMLCAIFVSLSGVKTLSALMIVAQFLFPALALLSGALGGYQFPLVSRIFFGSSASANLGILYALDLGGACIGALVLSVYLLPIFGFLKVGGLIAAVNLVPGLLACDLALGKKGLPE